MGFSGDVAKLPESARVRDLGAEKALIHDYSGRVVYELPQNALDRSDSRILVRWDLLSRCLEVANDGRPVTAHLGQSPDRSDFHALLSLHASSNTAQDSVGNKGMGFRSVFSAAELVEVWSRTEVGEWWVLRMQYPAEMRPADGVQWSEQYRRRWEGSNAGSQATTLTEFTTQREKIRRASRSPIGRLRSRPTAPARSVMCRF